MTCVRSLLAILMLTLSVAPAFAAGPIFLTGHDPDFHAQAEAGARNLLRVSLDFVTGGTYDLDDGNKFLWVEARISPPSGHRIGENGLASIGLVRGVHYDRANAAEFASVDLSQYTAIAIASSFGGLLTRAELDALIARKGDVADFVSAGGGLFAGAECYPCGANLLAGVTAPALFGYLPVDVISIVPAPPFTVQPFGASLGLVNGDVNSPTHNSFADAAGLEIVDTDAAGKPTTLAAVTTPSPCGFGVLSPELAFNPVDTSHTVSARPNVWIAGDEVLFEILSGPNAGASGAELVDANGEAQFTYVGTGGVGTDEIIATCADGTQSNTVIKIWEDPLSDLELVTACRPTPPCPGGTVRCDIHVRNRGPHLLPEIEVVMDLSGDLQIQTPADPLKVFAGSGGMLGMGPAPALVGQQITWVASDIPVGGKAATWFTLDVGASGGDKIVAVSGSYPDPNPGDDRDIEVITPDAGSCPPADFVQKSGITARGGGEVCADESIFYVIVFQNDEQGGATADVVDALDPCLDPARVSALLPGDVCTLNGSTVNCTDLPLDASGAGQVSFAVLPDAACAVGSDIVNDVTVTFEDGLVLMDTDVQRVVDCDFAGCGNGIVEPGLGEACEPPGTANCDDACILRCGNAMVDPGESCDDGNREDGDGCSAVCEVESMGCTHSQGYWKTHHRYRLRPSQQSPWPIDEDTLICGATWLETLQTVSAGGDAYYILSHQWIAAKLNVASGADGSTVAAELDEAEALLGECVSNTSDRARAIELAAILEQFNVGEIGPGRCEDETLCGLGFEIVLLLTPVLWLRRRCRP